MRNLMTVQIFFRIMYKKYSLPPITKTFTRAEFHRFIGTIDTKNRYQLVRAAFGIASINGYKRVHEIKDLKVKGMN